MESEQFKNLKPKQKNLHMLIIQLHQKKTVVLANTLSEYDYYVHKEAELMYHAGVAQETIKEVFKTKYIFVSSPEDVMKLRGMRYDIGEIKIYGSFWERRDAHKIYSEVLNAID